MIPYSIKYKNKDYIIDSLEEAAFFSKKEVTSINFHENSQVSSFGSNYSSFSTIHKSSNHQ